MSSPLDFGAVSPLPCSPPFFALRCKCGTGKGLSPFPASPSLRLRLFRCLLPFFLSSTNSSLSVFYGIIVRGTSAVCASPFPVSRPPRLQHPSSHFYRYTVGQRAPVLTPPIFPSTALLEAKLLLLMACCAASFPAESSFFFFFFSSPFFSVAPPCSCAQSGSLKLGAFPGHFLKDLVFFHFRLRNSVADVMEARS